MTDTFTAAVGRKVVSRASAENLGAVTHLVVDVDYRQITAIVVGRGRKAQLIGWDHLTGFGPDAVMVDDDGALRIPADDHEKAVVKGQFELVGQRALSERGNDLGTVDDVVFDPENGSLVRLIVAGDELPPGALLGAGSYAVVFADDAQ